MLFESTSDHIGCPIVAVVAGLCAAGAVGALRAHGIQGTWLLTLGGLAGAVVGAAIVLAIDRVLARLAFAASTARWPKP
ncbi:MAG: hypothetical protein HZB16_12455 [Armatimonadetes bacterium]|nr:hypothetical protein [Armatimonadota bacterium]